ncbi:hypothetical protein [Streptomyces boluensis]|uniref:Uncharacterized protein n=1 Tax=Streptomyces boluensis TaxID=1775135 RepID=A0A964XQJ3_9ACTN|nr:hypothetical protein [Streptomyces boluensis]NBE55882.1 hypothetical protein [Streptomyces boluensis]
MPASDPRESRESRESRETKPSGPSMSELLASCAAARAVSTPPGAPERRTVEIPEPKHEDDGHHGHRNAA